MNDKVWESLLNATEQLQSCDSNGTTRGVITDAYCCIDSCWSALAYLAGTSPPRNHKTKLDENFPIISTTLAAQGITYTEIESLYKLWLSVRYSQTSVTPNHAFQKRVNAHAVFWATLAETAKVEGMSVTQLEEMLHTALFGDRFQVYQEATNWVHEKYQIHAEIAAEMGYGAKLGNKLINPSNYCELSLVSDDIIVRDILAKEEIITDEVIAFYDSFLKVVLKLEDARRQKGIPDNDVPNFSLGLRIRYMGASIEDLGAWWGEKLAEAFNKFFEHKSEDAP